ncbi:hypothetical protein FACS1894103_1590 [Campylobacterota bacterium]|nr:hypothetical protein FACS1894103_1590 [Campylobacterota bacterium]
MTRLSERYLYEDIEVFDDHINEGFVEVGNSKNAPYAKWVHGGTGIYGQYKTPIVPKHKKALKTPYGIRKSVKGQKANPYLDKALDDYIGAGKLEQELDKFGKRICNDIVKDIKKAFGKLLK